MNQEKREGDERPSPKPERTPLKKKQRLVEIGLIVAVAALLANVVVSHFADDYYGEGFELKYGAPPHVVDSIFQAGLRQFDLTDEMIEREIDADFRSGVVRERYEVRVPADLPILSIVFRLQQLFDDVGVSIRAEERRFHRVSDVVVEPSEAFKIDARFRIDPDLERRKREVAFLVEGVEDLSEEELARLLEIPKNFTLVLVPSEATYDVAERAVKNGKEYVALLGDDIDDPAYRLDGDYAPDRLRISIRSIVASFPLQDFYLYDEDASAFGGVAFNFLKEQFGRRGRKLIPRSRFESVSTRSEAKTRRAIRDLVENIDGNAPAVILLHASSFLGAQDLIADLAMRGVKLKSASDALDETDAPTSNNAGAE
ncbi:MAG: hypothetical protein GF419_01475 [Ignavibacteriales bacterium]|nr:hypothetical protein [Ignavibacteriales bacterium]